MALAAAGLCGFYRWDKGFLCGSSQVGGLRPTGCLKLGTAVAHANPVSILKYKTIFHKYRRSLVPHKLNLKTKLVNKRQEGGSLIYKT